MSNWDAFMKDAATWVDSAGAGLLELARRHGLSDPAGPVSDHYPFAVLDGVVAGFEAAGFTLDEVADYDNEPTSFGPIVNRFGARAAVDTDQAPAAGPIVNRHGAETAAGDVPATPAESPWSVTLDDMRRMVDNEWSVRRTFGYDRGGWLAPGKVGPLVTADQGKALDALAGKGAADDDGAAWAKLAAGTGVDPDALKRHASLVKSAQEIVRSVGVEL